MDSDGTQRVHTCIYIYIYIYIYMYMYIYNYTALNPKQIWRVKLRMRVKFGAQKYYFDI